MDESNLPDGDEFMIKLKNYVYNGDGFVLKSSTTSGSSSAATTTTSKSPWQSSKFTVDSEQYVVGDGVRTPVYISGSKLMYTTYLLGIDIAFPDVLLGHVVSGKIQFSTQDIKYDEIKKVLDEKYIVGGKIQARAFTSS